MKLIDKDVVVAEIEKEVKNIYAGREYVGIHYDEECMVRGLQKAEDIIDTLEVKKVDLEKYLKEDIEDVFFDLDGVAIKGATHYLTVEDVKDIAKHFFELGIKAWKGE